MSASCEQHQSIASFQIHTNYNSYRIYNTPSDVDSSFQSLMRRPSIDGETTRDGVEASRRSLRLDPLKIKL